MKYIVEHMEDEFSEWVVLEYLNIIKHVSKDNFILTSLPKNITENDIPEELKKKELIFTNEDCIKLDFVKNNFDKVCLLDPDAKKSISPNDSTIFKYFIFGGILGSHPRANRTKILKDKYKFASRNLGSFQLTTDTAVILTKKVIEDKLNLDEIDYFDNPEIRYNKYESIEMPFRYIKNKNNEPIMPDGMVDLIKRSSNAKIDDFI